jgi:tRNA-uridine 2-sulfurtransferase
MKNTLNSKQHISNNESRKRVYVGMSGGVDSSVSAYLLKQQGYDVTGVFIKVWQPDSTDCGWKDERRDAMRVAAVLDIPFLTLDFSEQYKREVVDYMIEEYRLGRTPNPDVMCNRHVKFGSFLKYALEQGVDCVATGHYAQNIFVNTGVVSDLGEINKVTNAQVTDAVGHFEMREGYDPNKDQSYFLWTLTQDDLKHVLFPIGHLEKPEVRRIAEKAGLPVFDKKDSQGVCFIGHLDMKEFLKEYIQTKPGNVLDSYGTIIGSHEGAELYTIGERHGFTINNTGISSEPRFIISKDIKNNTLVVVTKTEQEKLLKSSVSSPQAPNLDTSEKRVILSNISFSQPIETYLGKKISARIRYRQEKQGCVIEQLRTNDSAPQKHTDNTTSQTYTVTFDKPQKGMAEGQSVVLYNGNVCLGGGILNFI